MIGMRILRSTSSVIPELQSKSCVRLFSEKKKVIKVCVIGSGPAGFYTAQQLLKDSRVEVDIYERLPVPFGLVRFGVAPDHPEVKNVTSTFTNTASNSRCKFYGNVNVGEDVMLKELQEAYHMVVLSYGAEEDRSLGIPGENLCNVLSARKFVGWYNGLPADMQTSPNLDVETAVVVGHGNVALDVARILLTPVNVLQETDITEKALEALMKNKVKRVVIVGRRGPLQVAFTIKELREMINLPGCRTVFDKSDFSSLAEVASTFPRPRKRLTELMIKTALVQPTDDKITQCKEVTKEWMLKFCRSPLEILPGSDSNSVGKMVLGINMLEGTGVNVKAVLTDEKENIECGLVLRSIGYKSVCIDSNLPFDKERGVIPNQSGRVLGRKGLYCSGWVKTGPVGVLVSTMNSSFETGKLMLEDLQKDLSSMNPAPGDSLILNILKAKGIRPVTFQDWLKIDKQEQQRGSRTGKPREKITSTREMLEVLDSC